MKISKKKLDLEEAFMFIRTPVIFDDGQVGAVYFNMPRKQCICNAWYEYGTSAVCFEL